MKVLIMSDIHGNMEALKAVREYLKVIKADKLILLGDLIDYGPHSNEVIEFIRNMPYEVVCNIRGNHEEAIIENNYEKFSSHRGKQCAQYTKSILNVSSWNYINYVMCPYSKQEFELEGKKCLAVHGSLEDSQWKAISPEDNLEKYQIYDYVFSAHSHLPHAFSRYYYVDNPMYRNKKRTMFINPGSVGQPRNHNPRAQFSLWDTKTDEISMCCVEYNIRSEQLCFPDIIDKFYKDRLEIGI